jgi:hypothetical protein
VPAPNRDRQGDPTALRAADLNEIWPPWDRPSAGRDRRKRRSHSGATINEADDAVKVLAFLLLAPCLLGAAEFRYEVRHDHLYKGHAGTLVINDEGVSYQESGKKPEKLHHGKWSYQDIQELRVSPDRMTVITYKDRKWALGADEVYEFELPSGQSFVPVYELLKNRLDRRFVAALADDQIPALWELPVKLLGAVTGSEGILRFASDHIVYKTDRAEASRTWRYQDIDNISTSDPYQLTLTTYEKSKAQYGSRKGFNFQLKQPLDEQRFNLVWRKLNQTKGLEILTSIQENTK